jgi:hypothetical protein
MPIFHIRQWRQVSACPDALGGSSTVTAEQLTQKTLGILGLMWPRNIRCGDTARCAAMDAKTRAFSMWSTAGTHMPAGTSKSGRMFQMPPSAQHWFIQTPGDLWATQLSVHGRSSGFAHSSGNNLVEKVVGQPRLETSMVCKRACSFRHARMWAFRALTVEGMVSRMLHLWITARPIMNNTTLL